MGPRFASFLEKISLLACFLGSGGEANYLPFFSLCDFWDPGGTPWAQGCPRAAPGLLFHSFCHGFVHILSPRGCFFRGFGIDLCTTHCPKSGRVPCEKLPRKPRKKNAIALPFERCTDDVNNQALVPWAPAGQTYPFWNVGTARVA